MAYTREDYLARLETVLQDDAGKLLPDDKYRLLSRAVLIFSKDRPRTLIHELTGDGTSYDFVMPTGWVDNFSYIKGEIEYPADDYQDPQYLESIDWKFYKKLAGTPAVTTTYLRFLTFIPVNSKKVRFEYTLPHTFNEATCTIDDNDMEAVVTLAASLCFWALAAKFSQTTDSTLEADVIDYQRKSDLYTNLAKEQLAMYNSLMGLGGEGSKGASAASAGVAVKDLDILYQWSEDMLTHPLRYR
jgi:hypothetical protein